MNYGLYLAASGALTHLHKQDAVANNLANASTVGFKRDLVSFMHRDAEAIEDQLDPDVRHDLLDRLGGGVWLHHDRLDMTDGAMQVTGKPLDVAVQGEGFFRLSVRQGDQTVQRLSRDGRFAVATDGRLITAVGGHTVTGSEGEPIVIDRTRPLAIDEHGNVRQDNSIVGRIMLVAPQRNDELKHLGAGLYTVSGAALDKRPAASGRIRQGHLEQSNVNPITEMLQMINTTRAIERSAQLMRYHDLLMDRAVNTLGRVA